MPIVIDARAAHVETAEANGFEDIVDFVIQAFRGPTAFVLRLKQLLIRYELTARTIPLSFSFA